MDFDVVIIGSGAGGAPIAHTLVNAGKSVLVLDKGPLLRTQSDNLDGISDFKRDELLANGPEKILNLPGVANNGQSYFPSHVEPDLNDEPHIYKDKQGQERATIEGYTANVVGGGTQLYGAVSVRFSREDFALGSLNAGRTDLANDPNGDVPREARDWPLDYDQMEPYYAKAERLVGINGTAQGQIKPFTSGNNTYQTPLEPNPISQIVADGMDTLGMARYRTPLAVITEDHAPSGRTAGNPKTGYVNRYGDPMGYKSNTWVSLLRPIKDNPNFELRPNCHVTHLQAQGDRVTEVHYLDPTGATKVVSGKVVVVACSAIESVRLLHISAARDADFENRINGNNLLGAYFLTHCFGGAEVRLRRRFDKSISLDSDWATDHCANPDWFRGQGLWAGGVMYNNTSDQALPLALARHDGSADLDTTWNGWVGRVFSRANSMPGDQFYDIADFFNQELGTRLSVSFMANQVPVRANRILLHPSIRDKWGLPVALIDKSWHSHDLAVMATLEAQCRAILEQGATQNGGFDNGNLESGFVSGNARIANHILGGARFGTDPTDSVLDPDCRAWNFENLYVADGCFMPTSGGGNPTLTIQANAFRVADRLLASGRI
ncbi:GMC oxidoreductase [Acanthopleuribacter pedis]|uniref:GMC family oxidoreductase n=1 Tax=Acanthopleuribacter pedis TaxID=442870 RepID=A0A8J7QQU0_9BACT|nr:GMC family oxidoreductase [Acanthopleuribacter pedis]MBO1323165.1 GMC family oxidoreductase [Acanthopleuribacter pedis]